MRRIRGIWTRPAGSRQIAVYRAGGFDDHHYLGLIACLGWTTWHVTSERLHLHGDFETDERALRAIAEAAGLSKKREDQGER